MKTVFFKNKFPITRKRLDLLIKKARLSKMGHARLCFHRNRLSNIQQMLICTTKRSIFYLHKHDGQFKSYVILLGKLKFIQLKRQKTLVRFLSSQQTNFIHVFDPKNWHTVKTVSDYALFVETRNGPYVKSKIFWKSINLKRI